MSSCSSPGSPPESRRDRSAARAAPFLLEGHRAVAPLDGDEGAEARVLWRHLQFALAVLPRGAAPGLSWGERPLAWLLEALRFFLESPGPRWRDLAP